MKRKRLTRRESREVTRARLIESAEKLFVRKGFDATSVEQIAAEAGFSRGAFYSNFTDKDSIFLSLLNKRHREIRLALDVLFEKIPSVEGRFLAARDWYREQWRQQRWTVLQTELHLRALRNRSVRKKLSALLQQEINGYSDLILRYYREAGLPAPEAPQVLAVSLYAVAHGLGILSLLHSNVECEQDVALAGDLTFGRLIPPPIEGAETRDAIRIKDKIRGSALRRRPGGLFAASPGGTGGGRDAS
ncbi:MAG TPA: TetR/AcrR family transcriptional regulator [Bryobacteraceae bacterium]|nr:TetR/AcrR family transcriptional regulator [Bryobacteraceae bacterium]